MKVRRKHIARRQVARGILAVPPQQARLVVLNTSNGPSGSGVCYTPSWAIHRLSPNGLSPGRLSLDRNVDRLGCGSASEEREKRNAEKDQDESASEPAL